MNITEQLADFVTEFEPRAASSDMLDAAKALILDGVGCMVAGINHPVVKILYEYIAQVGGEEQCTLVGPGTKTSPPLAAFVNGAMLHVNDFEIQGAVSTHGTSNILPPALCMVERSGGDGWDLLGGVIAGWEANAGVRGATPRHLGGFHPPGVIGPIGAVTAAGKVLGLTKHEMVMALGIAASRTGGLFANNGTMVKSTHPGNAGRMGVESAMLAKLGFESNPDIFGDPNQGYIHTLFGGKFDQVKFFADLGSDLVKNGYNIKPYPAEIWMQRIIEAIATIEGREKINPETIDYIEVELHEVREDLTRPLPRSGLDGKFSYEYCIAVAMLEPRVGMHSFSDEVRFSAPVVAMLPKVRLVANPEIPPSMDETWATARVGFVDGRVIENKCQSFRGSIRNPMTRNERIAKFAECTKQALSDEEIDSTIEIIENLEQKGSFGALMDVLGRVRPTARG